MSSTLSCKRASLLLTISLVFAFPLTAFADEPGAGVYVRDSAVAVEKFALADRMQRLGEWGKAADVYQELLQSQSDRVVLSPTNPSQYQSVIAAVQDRLCHWPPEGLDIYRGRFEVEAAGLLDQALAENRADGADDPAMLHRIFANYFVTDAAKTAGIRLMDTSIENGEFASAAWIGQRLLSDHPMLLDDRPRVLFREGLAHHFAGDDASAAIDLAELREKFPTTLGKVRDVDAVLSDALSKALDHPLAGTASIGAESWPMPFGSADRARLGVSTGFGGARLISVPLDNKVPRNVTIPIAARNGLTQLTDRDHLAGLTLGIFPAVDGGELFFQDNAHVYGVSLESGLPLPGWQQTYPGERNGRYTISGGGWPLPRCEQDAICITDDSVLAVMGRPDMNVANLTGRFMRDSRMVCLDRRTGRERWVATPQRLPAEPAALRQLDYAGSPLVVGNNVYLIARTGSGTQFEDCYVICLDLETGEHKWSSYLSSANNTAQMWEMDVSAAEGQNVSQIAYSGGRLYVATNVGAVAAIDAYSGSVIWLNMYPRQDAQPDRLMGAQIWGGRSGAVSSQDGEKPWTYNPVIVRDGKVFVVPGDGTFMHVYDAGSGAEIRRVGLSMRTTTDVGTPAETMDTLVGVGGDHGEYVVMASDRSVFCVDWKNYDASNSINSLHWAATFARGGLPEDSIRGRPFITADSVFVPLAWELARLSLRTGAQQASFPSSGTWDAKDDGPGNVLVTQDHLIIAGADHVNVYTDIAMATRKLDAAVAAAPTDPNQRLRYAEVLSAAEHYDGADSACAKLDEATALLRTAGGSIAMPTTEPSLAVVDPSIALPRSRLFNDAMAFAKKLEQLNRDPSGAIIDGLYDRAAVAAVTPSEWANYRLQRAARLHQKTDSIGELTLYQQILSDPLLRTVSVANGDSAASSAGTIARLAVADLIQRNGPAIYATYEQAAKDATQSAQGVPDAQRAEKLVAVAEMYPNSHAAAGAMLVAGDLYEANGSPRECASLMRQFCSRYPESPDRARAIESIARAYLEMPDRLDGLDVAIGRLEQGAKLSSQQRLSRPLKLPDGTQIEDVTFAQAADALRNCQAQIATKALPDPRIPADAHRKGLALLPEDPSAAISDVSDLILPLGDWARHDRVVTFSSRGLSVYAVGANLPLFNCPEVKETPKNVAWINGNLLVWCRSQLILVRGEGPAGASATMPSVAAGGVIWDSPLHQLPAAQFAAVGSGGDADGAAANAGGDDNDPIVQQRMIAANGPIVVHRGNGQIIIQRGGQLQIIGGPQGLIQQQQAVRGLLIAGGGGVLNLNQPNLVANAGTDSVVEQIDRVVPSVDRLVFSTLGPQGSSRVVSLNLADGHVQWQTSIEEHQIEQLAANDDFVAVRAVNDSEMRLVVFDAATGQLTWQPHAFGRENNDSDVPLNMCLAEDGSLVFLTADRICCKDLFDPDPKLRFERPVARNANNARMPGITFAGAIAPDQLVVSDGRVMAVSDNGTFVRVYSLSDGTPYAHDAKSEAPLGTEVTNSPWNVHLRVVGTRLYIFGPDKIIHYDLNKDDEWDADVNLGRSNTTVIIRDMVLTQHDVLLLMEPAAVQRRDTDSAYSPNLRIRTYSRDLGPGGIETGWLENLDRTLSGPTGITQVQVVDGGIYYATDDHRLHFLKGSAGAAPG